MLLENCSIAEAYQYCKNIVTEEWKSKWQTIVIHFFPRHKRNYFYVFLAYICLLDDIADEGTLPPEKREVQLNQFIKQLSECYKENGQVSHPLFIALRDLIQTFSIPQNLFLQFAQGMIEDLKINRFNKFNEVLLYCNKVSNCPGRILLSILSYNEKEVGYYADFACTGAQLLDFLIDLPEDLNKNRVYISLNHLSQFNYSEEALFNHEVNGHFKNLIQFEIELIINYLNQSTPLISYLKFRERLALKMILSMCFKLIEKIRQANYDLFSQPIQLTRLDKAKIILNAFKIASKD